MIKCHLSILPLAAMFFVVACTQTPSGRARDTQNDDDDDEEVEEADAEDGDETSRDEGIAEGEEDTVDPKEGENTDDPSTSDDLLPDPACTVAIDLGGQAKVAAAPETEAVLKLEPKDGKLKGSTKQGHNLYSDEIELVPRKDLAALAEADPAWKDLGCVAAAVKKITRRYDVDRLEPGVRIYEWTFDPALPLVATQIADAETYDEALTEERTFAEVKVRLKATGEGSAASDPVIDEEGEVTPAIGLEGAEGDVYSVKANVLVSEPVRKGVGTTLLPIMNATFDIDVKKREVVKIHAESEAPGTGGVVPYVLDFE